MTSQILNLRGSCQVNLERSSLDSRRGMRSTRLRVTRANGRAVPNRNNLLVRSVLDKDLSAPSTQDKGKWAPDSWKAYHAHQQPTWPDEDHLKSVVDRLETLPPLVFAGEARTLREQLAKVCIGEGFVLQGGDCAESFAEFRADNIRDTLRVLLQMSAILMYGSGLPVVKLGRMAGQFAKPRSSDTETIDGVTLPSYRGDNINSDEFTPEARIPNPDRLIQAYNQCSSTLNLLRGFTTGGYGCLERVTKWNLDFMEGTEQGKRYEELAASLDEAMQFMKACGIGADHPIMKSTDFYTSHESLLLHYEQALTRLDSTSDQWYGCSAHMLWIGERTRQLDGAHIEFMRGIANPIGIKISDKCEPEELVELISTINPDNVPGKICIIMRMGAEKMYKYFPRLIQAVEDNNLHVVWISDPMHGNTVKSETGYKTRRFEAIRAELRAFFDVHDQMGTHAGGVHLEMTGQDVTECTGGSSVDVVTDSDLPLRYHTHCDPRLNASQSLELAFLISDRLYKRRVVKKNIL